MHLLAMQNEHNEVLFSEMKMRKWVFKARSDICQFGNEMSFPFEHEFDFWVF